MRFTKTLKLDPTTVVDGRENRRQIGEALDELYFEGEMAPGMGALSGAATFNNTPLQAPVVDFPVGGLWRVEVRRRRRWQRCGIHYRVYYTADAGGGGNYSLSLAVLPLAAGDTLGVPANTLNVALALPAPAAANDILGFEGVDASAAIVPGSKPLLRMSLFRNAGNVNLLRVLAVHYELLPQG